MKQKVKLTSLLLFVLSFALLFGCASKSEEVAPQPPVSDRPTWVDKGSGAFEGEMGKTFYGVASAWGIKNPSLLRTTADNRARAEIAKVFKVYTAALMKDYAASTMAGDPEVVSEEQHVESTIKTFTKAELAGVEIVDHYKDRDTGELFALARMSLTAFEDYLSKSQELSEKARERVIQHAEKAFDDLAKEEAKHE